MVRGVSFTTITSSTQPALWQVLQSINVSKYVWYNIESQCDVWENIDGDEFFDEDYYDGQSFYDKIHIDPFQIIFLKLQAYFEGGNFTDVRTYQEFLDSDCQILLLVNDTNFFQIYVKDPEISKALYENAIEQNFKDIKYITDSNDTRTKMYVI